VKPPTIAKTPAVEAAFQGKKTEETKGNE